MTLYWVQLRRYFRDGNHETLGEPVGPFTDGDSAAEECSRRQSHLKTNCLVWCMEEERTDQRRVQE